MIDFSPPSLRESGKDKKLRMLQLINELNTLVNEQTQTNHGIKSFGTRDEFNSNTFYDYVKENARDVHNSSKQTGGSYKKERSHEKVQTRNQVH